MRVVKASTWIALVCVAILGGKAYGQDFTAAEVKKIYREATVSIGVHFLDASNVEQCEHGSGAIVSSDGFIITAQHLFEDADHNRYENITKIRGVVGGPYNCKDPLGTVLPFEFIRQQTDIDAALLRVQDLGPFDRVFTCKETEIVDGETVFVLGYPLGQQLDLVDGPIGSLLGPGGLVKLSLELNPGNSGGPVFNKFGRFIGMQKAI